MNSTPESNQYAPPTAHVEDISGKDGTGLAGRGTRFGAGLVDGLLAMVAVGALSLVTPWNPFDPAHATSFKGGIMNGALGFLIFLAIHGYLLATRGQTVGKLLLGIRIVRTDGSRASFGRIVGLRYLVGSVMTTIPTLGYLYILADCLLIFRESRKCLHDNIADTIVVKA